MGPGIEIQAIHNLFSWCAVARSDCRHGLDGPNLHETLARFGDWTIETITGFPFTGVKVERHGCGAEPLLDVGSGVLRLRFEP